MVLHRKLALQIAIFLICLTVIRYDPANAINPFDTKCNPRTICYLQPIASTWRSSQSVNYQFNCSTPEIVDQLAANDPRVQRLTCQYLRYSRQMVISTTKPRRLDVFVPGAMQRLLAQVRRPLSKFSLANLVLQNVSRRTFAELPVHNEFRMSVWKSDAHSRFSSDFLRFTSNAQKLPGGEYARVSLNVFCKYNEKKSRSPGTSSVGKNVFFMYSSRFSLDYFECQPHQFYCIQNPFLLPMMATITPNSSDESLAVTEKISFLLENENMTSTNMTNKNTATSKRTTSKTTTVMPKNNSMRRNTSFPEGCQTAKGFVDDRKTAKYLLFVLPEFLNIEKSSASRKVYKWAKTTNLDSEMCDATIKSDAVRRELLMRLFCANMFESHSSTTPITSLATSNMQMVNVSKKQNFMFKSTTTRFSNSKNASQVTSLKQNASKIRFNFTISQILFTKFTSRFPTSKFKNQSKFLNFTPGSAKINSFSKSKKVRPLSQLTTENTMRISVSSFHWLVVSLGFLSIFCCVLIIVLAVKFFCKCDDNSPPHRQSISSYQYNSQEEISQKPQKKRLRPMFHKMSQNGNTQRQNKTRRVHGSNKRAKQPLSSLEISHPIMIYDGDNHINASTIGRDGKAADGSEHDLIENIIMMNNAEIYDQLEMDD